MWNIGNPYTAQYNDVTSAEYVNKEKKAFRIRALLLGIFIVFNVLLTIGRLFDILTPYLLYISTFEVVLFLAAGVYIVMSIRKNTTNIYAHTMRVFEEHHFKLPEQAVATYRIELVQGALCLRGADCLISFSPLTENNPSNYNLALDLFAFNNAIRFYLQYLVVTKGNKHLRSLRLLDGSKKENIMDQGVFHPKVKEKRNPYLRYRKEA